MATGQFNPAQLAQARLPATVPMSTIKMSISLRDKHLQNPGCTNSPIFRGFR